MTTSSPGIHTCANCFAEFEWTPFVQDGEDFCCSGCAGGGPCICTYEGAPHVTGAGTVTITSGPGYGGPQEGESEGQEDSESGPPESVGGEEGPPEEPPAPGVSPAGPEEEPVPTNGRLAVIMAAVAEMPLPVQEVVRARLSTPGTEEEIGEPLGLTGDEVRQLLRQGQAILDRALGPGFRIRYIAAEQLAQDETPEPEFPPFDEGLAGEEPARPAGEPEPSELGRMIARSVDSLATASNGEGPESEAARDVLSEALREVSNLFRIASERLGGQEPPARPLRTEFAETREGEEPVTLIVENAGEIGPFFVALRESNSVQWARLETFTPERSVFRLAINSMMGLVRDLMAMEGRNRPTRLQISGQEVTVELPEAPVQPVVQPVADGPPERFEISVDSFFGARHFVESGDRQSVPHHHSYRVEASFASSQPDRYGFVVGFAQIREMVDSTVMDYSETLLNTEEPFGEIPPTTENLARVFHGRIMAKLQALNLPTVRLRHVRVWESPTNSATYSDAAASA